MASGALVLWVAVALGQTPSAGESAAWLKVVPADIDLVARARGVQAVRDDLVKMVENASPQLAAQVCPTIQDWFDQIRGRYGDAATKAPLFFLFKLPKPEAVESPPYAFLLKSDDYVAVQRQLAGPRGNAGARKHPGGFDQIQGSDGQPVYTYKGSGFVAFSNSDALMTQIVKPKATLESALSETLRTRLLSGDVGFYANLNSFQDRFKDEIDQIRQQVLAGFDQPQAGANADMVKRAKETYGQIFDSLKDGQSLATSFDFAPEGLDVAGEATMKPGSPTSKILTGPKTGTGDELGKLPKDLTNFVFFQGSRASTEKLVDFGMGMIAPGGDKPSEAFKKALELQHQSGAQTIATASSVGAKGLEGATITVYDDPQKAFDAMTATLKAATAPGSQLKAMIKDFALDAKAETYKGLVLNRAKITWDPQKVAQIQANSPNASSLMQSMVKEPLTVWYGVEGKTLVTVIAGTWDRAKGLLDAMQGGSSGVGSTASFRAIRPKLPAQVNGLVFLSSQGLVGQLTTMLNAMAGGEAAVPLPADLPKDPVLVGGSFITKPGTIEFQGTVPAAAGGIFEKGLGPVLNGLDAKVKQ
jgi:hypothetical protein